VKNPAVILLPLVSLAHWQATVAARLAWSVALFTFASITVYTLNDIRDRDNDRRHLRKRERPIASGQLSLRVACIFALAMAVLTAGLALVHPFLAWPVYIYLLLNLAYSIRLKHVPLVDAFVVALGFVLRAELGYIALGIRPSPSLMLAVLTVCLMFVLGKRRRELTEGSQLHRPVLSGYSVQLIDYLILISGTLSVVAYLLLLRSATLAAHAPAALMALTAPCALFALFRYLQLLVVKQDGGDPVRTLFGDLPLIVCAVLWLVIVICTRIFATPLG